MFAVSLLLPLLVPTPALGSAGSAEDLDSQQILRVSEPPSIVTLSGQPIECPPDMSCGGSHRRGNGRAWCQNRSGARCGANKLFAAPSYGDLRVTVGCESLPIDAPLCPVGRCEPDCLCRESLLKRIQALLLGDLSKASEDKDSTKEEL